jgi:hydroxymethylpyrimidine/phosphomethylpyrimidine kinase
MRDAAAALCALGARAALVKGGHLRDRACDVLATATEVHALEAARLAVGPVHGHRLYALRGDRRRARTR